MSLKYIAIAGCMVMLGMPGVSFSHCGSCGVGDENHGKPGSAHADPLEAMSKELNLSEDQKTKIKAIKEDMHKKKESLHQETHAKISAVLTKEQNAKFDKMKTTTCDMCKHGKEEHKH